MNTIPDYSHYSLNELYQILADTSKWLYPERVEALTNRIKQLTPANLSYLARAKHKKRLKYALLPIRDDAEVRPGHGVSVLTASKL